MHFSWCEFSPHQKLKIIIVMNDDNHTSEITEIKSETTTSNFCCNSYYTFTHFGDIYIYIYSIVSHDTK